MLGATSRWGLAVNQAEDFQIDGLLHLHTGKRVKERERGQRERERERTERERERERDSGTQAPTGFRDSRVLVYHVHLHAQLCGMHGPECASFFSHPQPFLLEPCTLSGS